MTNPTYRAEAVHQFIVAPLLRLLRRAPAFQPRIAY
jgi:hypothetical protein